MSIILVKRINKIIGEYNNKDLKIKRQNEIIKNKELKKAKSNELKLKKMEKEKINQKNIRIRKEKKLELLKKNKDSIFNNLDIRMIIILTFEIF